MASRYPNAGETVLDRMGKAERRGRVVGFNHIKGTVFVKVKFDDQKSRDEPEEFEYPDFFSQLNCGNGRWDNSLNAWVMENDPDALPNDDPFVVAFNNSIKDMNVKLLEDRMGEDKDANVLQLETLAIQNELEAKKLGENHLYFNFYKYKADDYRRYLNYRITGELNQ